MTAADALLLVIVVCACIALIVTGPIEDASE